MGMSIFHFLQLHFISAIETLLLLGCCAAGYVHFLDEKGKWYPNCWKILLQKCRPVPSPYRGPAPTWEIPSRFPEVTFCFLILPLLQQIQYNAFGKAAFWPQRSSLVSGKWSSSVCMALHLLGILCYHFNKPAKVPWQLGVITTAEAGSDGRNPMQDLFVYLFVCSLISVFPFLFFYFLCFAQCELFHLQTKEGSCSSAC